MKCSTLKIVAVMFTLQLTGCETLKSIDKGLYSATDSVTATDRVTGERVMNLAGRKRQIAESKARIQESLRKLDAEGVKYNERLDAKAYARLKRVFGRIHAVSHMREESWDVYLIPKPGFNAFVSGGAEVVAHLDAVNQTNDDELAAVLGHELGHVAANHIYETQGHQVLAALAGKKQEIKTTSYQAAFSREHEKEADQIGVLYVALSGYDPYAASHLWDRLYRESGNYRGWDSTHPANSERAAQTKMIANKVKDYYTQNERNPNFVTLLENNTLWRKRTTASKPGEGGGVLAVVNTVLNAKVQHERTRTEAMRNEAHIKALENFRNATQLVKVEPVAPNTLRLWFMWNGQSTRPREVAFLVRVEQIGQKPIEIIRAYKEPIYYSRAFPVEVEHRDINAAQINPQSLRYMINDVVLYGER